MRFTPEQLIARFGNALLRANMWNGPYPWRQCSRCFEQIHVGSRYLCDACLDELGDMIEAPILSKDEKDAVR